MRIIIDDEVEENLFDKEIEDESKVTPITSFNPTVVHVMKNLLALCNEDANHFVEQVAQEKLGKKI